MLHIRDSLCQAEVRQYLPSQSRIPPHLQYSGPRAAAPFKEHSKRGPGTTVVLEATVQGGEEATLRRAKRGQKDVGKDEEKL